MLTRMFAKKQAKWVKFEPLARLKNPEIFKPRFCSVCGQQLTLGRISIASQFNRSTGRKEYRSCAWWKCDNGIIHPGFDVWGLWWTADSVEETTEADEAVKHS